MPGELEQPLIRPPSESRSVLVRLTRGCKWNRCRFCGIYPSLGEAAFAIRDVDDVKRDVERLHQIMPLAETAFVGDADPLQAGLETFLDLARHLGNTFPLRRLTCYARASTLHALGRESLGRLAGAGLSRVHIGLESGDRATLAFHRKGQTPALVSRVARRLKEAGIEISFYVLLGMGGRERWEDHVLQTARLVNETAPDFLRIRRLWIYEKNDLYGENESPLWEQIRRGNFSPQTPEGTVRELRLLVENLSDDLDTFLASDHGNNYVQVTGVVRDCRKDMLLEIDSFLARNPAERRAHYERVGSRL